jgi:signal transduction histidine kinase
MTVSGEAIIQVQDTGIGIPQSDLDQIYEPF